jgi:hypothetical protein
VDRRLAQPQARSHPHCPSHARHARAARLGVTANRPTWGDNGDHGINGDANCSLQEAIYAANLDASKAPDPSNPGQFFTTGCVAGDGADTINLLPPLREAAGQSDYSAARLQQNAPDAPFGVQLGSGGGPGKEACPHCGPRPPAASGRPLVATIRPVTTDMARACGLAVAVEAAPCIRVRRSPPRSPGNFAKTYPIQ